MKMRIQGNVIRFRLNRREVGEFEGTGRVSAAIDFPGGGQLCYTLVRGGSQMNAALNGSEIQIKVPEPLASEWTGTDRVGMQARVPVEGGQELEILIEKDFQCMHKGEEGKDPDAYPNPMAAETA